MPKVFAKSKWMPRDSYCHFKLKSLSKSVVSSHREARSSRHLRIRVPLLPGTIANLYLVYA